MSRSHADGSERHKSAVVLLSGGLDSYTAAAIARRDGFRLFALTIRYGQRHAREIDAARDVARALDVARHIELDVDLSAFGGSALTSDLPLETAGKRGHRIEAAGHLSESARLNIATVAWQVRSTLRSGRIRSRPT